MGPDRQIHQEQLEASVETAEQVVAEQRMNVEEEQAEVEALREELREAEMAAQAQEQVEAEGREVEQAINDVAGV